jgi:hypothetical protein
MTRSSAGLLLGVLAVTVFLSGSARAAESEDEKLTALFKGLLEEEFQHRPLDATRLGDHRFDDRLDDLSPETLSDGAPLSPACRKRLTPASCRNPAGSISRFGAMT